MKYIYKHTVTEATTGYFACEPEEHLSLEQNLQILSKSPLDDFLHRHVLRSLIQKDLAELQELWKSEFDEESKKILQVLLHECAVLNPSHDILSSNIPAIDKIHEFTPLPYLTWAKRRDKEEHAPWINLFADNIEKHEKLPHPDEIEEEGLSRLYTKEELEIAENIPKISDIHKEFLENKMSAWSRPPAQETAQKALTLLVENAILDGIEMRHEASLSPIALLRPWHLNLQVNNGRNNFTLEGQATTYGRGLSLAQARASYSMEMIERASAYISVANMQFSERAGHIPLYYGTYSELKNAGHNVIDPNSLYPEAPYEDVHLYWVEARQANLGNADITAFIPAQCISLFSNLDEISLFMNPGSTGLASGNSLAEAKQAAITEIIERDAEATIPYDRKRCFILQSKDERIASLLEDYKARGVYVHFMDLTSEFGVPCYQAFVLSQKGEVIRATGANLSGQKAALAALTEVPYPYPNSKPSGAMIKALPIRYLEDLPDYSLESPSRNVALLEHILCRHGYNPLYVDISHEYLEMPVVRVIIPKLQQSAEFDKFSCISKRLYRNYIATFA